MLLRRKLTTQPKTHKPNSKITEAWELCFRVLVFKLCFVFYLSKPNNNKTKTVFAKPRPGNIVPKVFGFLVYCFFVVLVCNLFFWKSSKNNKTKFGKTNFGNYVSVFFVVFVNCLWIKQKPKNEKVLAKPKPGNMVPKTFVLFLVYWFLPCFWKCSKKHKP